jgi:excisionase family DNA binding protein
MADIGNKPMTTGQAAEYIGVSLQAIRDWIEDGKFPTAYKIGDRWALAPDEVERANEYYHSKDLEDVE